MKYASGRETLEVNAVQPNYARLDLYWESAATANGLIGEEVVVRLKVHFEGAPDEFDEKDLPVVITGVRAAPVPVISGSGLTEPVPCRQGCRLGFDSFASISPDGEGYSAFWGVDRINPPGVSVTMVGSEGNQFGVLVSPVLTDTEIVVRLMVASGLHRIDATATARVTAIDPGG